MDSSNGIRLYLFHLHVSIDTFSSLVPLYYPLFLFSLMDCEFSKFPTLLLFYIFIALQLYMYFYIFVNTRLKKWKLYRNLFHLLNAIRSTII